MNRLTTWLLIVGSYATATGQTGAPEASSSPNSMAGLFSSVDQCEKDKSAQAPPALRNLLTAKTVFVVGEPLVLVATSKGVQTLKKALVGWGRFHLVDDAETADLIIVVSEYSTSKPTRMEPRVRVALAIFAGGSTPCAEATPLWAVQEVGPVLGQRPTGKLVEDLRKLLAKLEKSVRASAAPSPTGAGSQEVFRSLTRVNS